ncbi:P-loop containing nucleoside triphosphate hydrolase protein, partial [Ochromonadaceae sp. CCMP2298]
MAESRVRVGVRIRPLLSKEKGQNVTFSAYDAQSVSFKAQTYTYDHVFGMELSQSQLYEQTAEPMLKSFLEGYNCTIMAYGQTGSGKTYSMGTSDITYQDTENQGLISRFVADLFANLNVSKAEGEHLSFAVKASYLEIYGEEVFDLLHSDSASPQRLPLQVREDEGGKIFVQGQNEFEVEDAEATLEMLSAGARHRITACTAMNAGSSRSHAVFTLQLEQRIRSRTAGAEGEEDVQTLRSKLTFVDLAGSERIKRTGAEGQRLKEGIQINSGLFNLGQVINSLADEQKLKNGVKNNHVPYRNSKLTHLLKDALGGNSQTLFLACVSPAESNESETQSTLQYAKQARNIQNKPVQNVDKVQRELQRLRMAVKAWTCRAVTSMFGNK